MRPHDLIVVPKGNGFFRAIAEVIGPYEYQSRPPDIDDDKVNPRRVRWLWIDRAGAPVENICAKNFVMGSLYELSRKDLNLPVLERYIVTGLTPSERSTSSSASRGSCWAIAFRPRRIGSRHGYALLFEMNVLFEEYIGRMLARALADEPLAVQRQGGGRYCLIELDAEEP